jgi:uncharacterized protein (UPF0332 family)
MAENDAIYLDKALESLRGAASEYTNGRYNNCAARAYYAAFQAAIHALEHDGVHAVTWGHDFVQAEFVGRLIIRRKRYDADLRDTLVRNLELRQAADYRRQHVSQTQAARALRWANTLVTAVQRGGETQ